MKKYLSTLKASVALLACFLIAPQVSGQVIVATSQGTVWKAPLQTTNDWFNEGLWTQGLPTADMPAWLINGSETLLSSGSAQAASLQLAMPNGGRSLLTQTDGELGVTGDVRIDDGIYRIIGGQLDAAGLNVGATFGSISILPDRSEVPLPEIPCTTTDGGICVPYLVHFTSESHFSLEGGRVNLTRALNVNGPTTQISGGILTTPELRLNQQLTTTSNVAVSHTGGKVKVAGSIKIQDGTYALSGGELTAERIAMGDPADDSLFQFPRNGTLLPQFLQTGGTLTVNNNLELCEPGFIFPIPSIVFEDVLYRLEAGTVDVGADTIVGSLGIAPARFLQSGGQMTTAGTLRIEGERSRYQISGGRLTADRIEVGTNVFNEGGLFSIESANAVIQANSGVTLGAEARLEATPGSQLLVTGGAFSIQGNTASLLSGLENLSLIFTGGDEISKLEAAGIDRGDSEESFVENYMLNRLQVGNESESGNLQLVDFIGNHDPLSPDAVYVERLVVTSGSTLDLGGLNLYYRQAEISGNVIMSGGALLASVPEPASILLAGLAAFGFWSRRSSEEYTSG